MSALLSAIKNASTAEELNSIMAELGQLASQFNIDISAALQLMADTIEKNDGKIALSENQRQNLVNDLRKLENDQIDKNSDDFKTDKIPVIKAKLEKIKSLFEDINNPDDKKSLEAVQKLARDYTPEKVKSNLTDEVDTLRKSQQSIDILENRRISQGGKLNIQDEKRLNVAKATHEVLLDNIAEKTNLEYTVASSVSDVMKGRENETPNQEDLAKIRDEIKVRNKNTNIDPVRQALKDTVKSNESNSTFSLHEKILALKDKNKAMQKTADIIVDEPSKADKIESLVTASSFKTELEKHGNSKPTPNAPLPDSKKEFAKSGVDQPTKAGGFAEKIKAEKAKRAPEGPKIGG